MYTTTMSIHKGSYGGANMSEHKEHYIYNYSRQGGHLNYTEEPEPLYDVPTSVIVLLSFLYGSISVLAVVGNFLVMWVVGTSRRMQSVTNCYIANLALADIVIGLFAVPFQFQAALLQRWLLPHFMCPFCPFVQALSVNVSVFTLTAIAVDRHRAIITPLSAHTSRRVAKAVIAFVWASAIALAIPMALSWEVIMEDEFNLETRLLFKKPFCVPTNFGLHSLYIYRLLLFLFQYLTPLCIMTCAYMHMAMKLWVTRAPGNAQELRDATHMKNKKRVIKMLVIVVLLFAVCWLPLQTYYLLQTYFPRINEYKYINIMFFCFDWLAMSNSCYNPFIYGIYNEKFQKEFKQKITFGKKQWTLNDSFENEKSHSVQTRVDSSIRSTSQTKRCLCRMTSPNRMRLTGTSSVRYDFRNSHDRTTWVDEGGGTRLHNNRKLNRSLIIPKNKRNNQYVATFNTRRQKQDRFYTSVTESSSLTLDTDDDSRIVEFYILSNSKGIDIKHACPSTIHQLALEERGGVSSKHTHQVS